MLNCSMRLLFHRQYNNSPFIKIIRKLEKKTVEHRIRKNQQIRSTVHDAKSYLK